MRISALLFLGFLQGATAAPRIVGFGPQIRYVGVHGTYSFHVVAYGGILRYQWWNQEIDATTGHAISSTFNFPVNRPRLSVPDAQNTRDYNGWYWCVVTDAVTGESVTSPRGECIVVAEPTVTQQPLSQSVPTGSAVTFSVAVDAHAPVSVKYQWFFKEKPLFGATQPTLLIAHARPYRQGEYACRVKTIGGISFSDAAFLTVTSAN
jgi:hypothetical protein